MISTIIIGLVVLSALVLVHELGHFIAAKVSGVGVEEFGLGFPPRLFGIKRGETIYSLNAIPFGGFNRLPGEVDPDVPGSLASKSAGTRLIVMSAGSLMNFLLPLLLFSAAFMVPHDAVSGQVLVTEVIPGSPAARAGIESGDTLLQIKGNSVRNIGDVHRYIQLNLGREIPILVKHGDATTEEVRLIPRWRPPEGQGAIGIVVELSSPTIVRQYYPFWQAIPMGVGECIETFILFKNGIIGTIIGTAPVAATGPVGIVQITGEASKAGISPLLELAAFISIAIGITQLLPIPALDGGRMVFVFLELVRRGKRVPPKVEGLIHIVGFAMLMALIVAITYQDIIRIISGESLMP